MGREKSISITSPVFLYEQVKNEIKEMITKGELTPGMKLPNENELCDTFNTSRITIRRALKELATEGVIEIIHGKGTFVKVIKQQLHILNLKGFSEGLSSDDNNNFTKEILIKEVETSDKKLMELFNRDEPFEYIHLVRIIKDGYNDVFSIDYAYLPSDIYPGIFEKIEDNVSTFKIIHNDYGVKFKKARKEIEFTQPTLEISKHLNCSRLEPVIQIEKLIMDDNEKPVHYSQYYLLGRKVNFYIDVDIQDE